MQRQPCAGAPLGSPQVLAGRLGQGSRSPGPAPAAAPRWRSSTGRTPFGFDQASNDLYALVLANFGSGTVYAESQSMAPPTSGPNARGADACRQLTNGPIARQRVRGERWGTRRPASLCGCSGTPTRTGFCNRSPRRLSRDRGVPAGSPAAAQVSFSRSRSTPPPRLTSSRSNTTTCRAARRSASGLAQPGDIGAVQPVVGFFPMARPDRGAGVRRRVFHPQTGPNSGGYDTGLFLGPDRQFTVTATGEERRSPRFGQRPGRAVRPGGVAPGLPDRPHRLRAPVVPTRRLLHGDGQRVSPLFLAMSDGGYGDNSGLLDQLLDTGLHGREDLAAAGAELGLDRLQLVRRKPPSRTTASLFTAGAVNYVGRQ